MYLYIICLLIYIILSRLSTYNLVTCHQLVMSVHVWRELAAHSRTTRTVCRVSKQLLIGKLSCICIALLLVITLEQFRSSMVFYTYRVNWKTLCRTWPVSCIIDIYLKFLLPRNCNFYESLLRFMHSILLIKQKLIIAK